MKEHLSIRLAVGLVLACVALAAQAGEAGAAGATSAPRLAGRLSSSSVVAVGHVSRVQPFDHDRVRVIHLTLDRVVKGKERLAAGGGALEIVEMRDRPAAPGLLSVGDHAIVFVRRMKRGSYLDETIGSARRWQASGGVFGVIGDPDQTAIREAAALLDRMAEWSRAPAVTAGERADARRAWVFDAVSADHGALVEEGAAGLAEISGLDRDLQPAERARLEKAVARSDLPPRVRAALITAIGEAGLTALAPTLVTLKIDAPVVLEASWRAQTTLGAPPSVAEVERRLRDGDPGVRAVAARGYVQAAPKAAVPALGRFLAGEDEPSVRIATLEALGTLHDEDALKVIETSFVEDGELAVRQAAGRVVFEQGGDVAAESLGRLAFEAAPEGQRHAVALLMALRRPADDPTLKRIRETHSDPKVKELLEHGFPDGHH